MGRGGHNSQPWEKPGSAGSGRKGEPQNHLVHLGQDLSSESMDAGGIHPSACTQTWGESFPTMAGSKANRGWGGDQWQPRDLLAAPGRGPMAAPGDRWHPWGTDGSPAAPPRGEARVDPASPKAVRDPTALPGVGVQAALAEHWDRHPQRWPRPTPTHQTCPSTRTGRSQGRGEAEGNYPSWGFARAQEI